MTNLKRSLKFRDRCEVCKEEQAKYRCPRCGLETCCLKCVNKHKTENDCNGERDKTAFVAVNDFTDIHLLSGRLKIRQNILYVDLKVLFDPLNVSESGGEVSSNK